jgi:hypothetical protein
MLTSTKVYCAPAFLMKRKFKFLKALEILEPKWLLLRRPWFQRLIARPQTSADLHDLFNSTLIDYRITKNYCKMEKKLHWNDETGNFTL